MGGRFIESPNNVENSVRLGADSSAFHVLTRLVSANGHSTWLTDLNNAKETLQLSALDVSQSDMKLRLYWLGVKTPTRTVASLVHVIFHVWMRGYILLRGKTNTKNPVLTLSIWLGSRGNWHMDVLNKTKSTWNSSIPQPGLIISAFVLRPTPGHPKSWL